jgi:hypothetical protein
MYKILCLAAMMGALVSCPARLFPWSCWNKSKVKHARLGKPIFYLVNALQAYTGEDLRGLKEKRWILRGLDFGKSDLRGGL